jgi:exopolysaccharide biosynthesis polyprenyl glycosylphosphotransferase
VHEAVTTVVPSSGSDAVAAPSSHAAPEDVTARNGQGGVPAAVPAVNAGVAESPPRASRRIRRGWVVRRLLVAADVIGLLTAFVAVEVLFGDNGSVSLDGTTETAAFLLSLPAWVLAAKLYGLYDRDEERTAHSTVDEVLTVFHLVTVVVWLYFLASWLLGVTSPDQAKLSTFWALAIVGLIATRSVARTLARRHPAYVQNAIVVGAGDVGQLIGRKLAQHPEYGINLLGYVDATPKEMRADLTNVQLLGEPDDIVEIVRRHNADRVVVAFSRDRHDETLHLVTALRDQDVQIDVVPRLYEAIGPKAVVHAIEGLPLLGLTPVRITRSSRMLKRGMDVIGASVLLVLTAPLLAVVAVLVRRDSPGPVFFRQVRLGVDMREFTMLKFRTMRVGTDDTAHREFLTQVMTPGAVPPTGKLYKLDRSDVTTRIGQWLRRTSLDELPQLLNVVRGDMSLVGPRPSLPYELALFEPHHFERFSVPAGLTGLWQVEARAHSTWREALDLDVLYVRSWSIGLDLRLLMRSPGLMLRKRETA